MTLEPKRADQGRGAPSLATNIFAIFFWVAIGAVTLLRAVPTIWGPGASPLETPANLMLLLPFALAGGATLLVTFFERFRSFSASSRMAAVCLCSVGMTLFACMLVLPDYSPSASAQREIIAGHVIADAYLACVSRHAELAAGADLNAYTHLPSGLKRDGGDVWTISCRKADGGLFPMEVSVPAS